MYKRKNWKRKRQLQLLLSVCLCIGLISALSILWVMQLHAEKGKVQPKAKVQETVEIKENIKEVECILQNPELPTGCEATAGTMLLNAYGYPVDKVTVAEYLEKSVKVEKDGRSYALHPDEAFTGNPDTVYGYGAFPNVLVKAMQKVVDEQDGKYEVCSLYGKTEEELLKEVAAGTPICIWSSMNNLEIEYRGGWYLIKDGEYTDEYFYWPSNEHVLVLTDYDETTVTVCDPMKGVCSYPRESFFRHYEQVGKYAVMMVKRK